MFRVISEKLTEVLYTHQRKYAHCSSHDSAEPGYVNVKELAEAMCRYDLDDMDMYWLYAVNAELDRMGKMWGCKGLIHCYIPVMSGFCEHLSQLEEQYALNCPSSVCWGCFDRVGFCPRLSSRGEAHR